MGEKSLLSAKFPRFDCKIPRAISQPGTYRFSGDGVAYLGNLAADGVVEDAKLSRPNTPIEILDISVECVRGVGRVDPTGPNYASPKVVRPIRSF